MIAIPLVGVLGLHAGPGGMGLLTAAGWAPNLLLSLHAGAWVDRSGRPREAMIAADLGRRRRGTGDAARAMCGADQLVNYGVRPIGAVGGGALGAAIGLQPTLWIAGIGALASALWLALAGAAVAGAAGDVAGWLSGSGHHPGAWRARRTSWAS